NRKYELKGHLFENRYVSQPIPSDYSFMITSAYIHNNPRSTGVHPINYPWSSYSHFIFQETRRQGCKQHVKSYRSIHKNELLKLYANPSNWHSYTHEGTSP